MELGGNFIDTADIYQYGDSETIVGQFPSFDYAIEKATLLNQTKKIRAMLVHSCIPESVS